MASSHGRPLTAVVGCGYWGKNLVRNVHTAGALAAVSDVDGKSAAKFAEEYGVPVLEYQQILSEQEIRAVVLATPAELHSGMARAALSEGKHVFVEKPLALRVHEAEELTRLAAANDRTLMVGHLLQYHPAFLKLRELVDQGVLGRLQYIYSNRLNLGKIRRSEDVFWSFAPHDISMILSLAGEPPDRVTATGASYLHRSLADVTTTHLAFPSGVSAHVFVSWLHPFKEQKLVVVGDRGMMVFDDTLPWAEKLRLFPHRVDWRNGVPQPRKADAEPVVVEPAEPLLCEIEHFLECVETGSRPRTDGEEGTRVLRVLDKAAQAAARGFGDESPSVTSLRPRNAAADYFVHDSSFVDEGASIGEGTKIWHFSHVLSGSRIGRDSVIGQNVMIGPDVVIGDGCKIQNNVSLYKGVELADGVFCGPSSVFTNVLNPRAEVERKDEFRLTHVGKGATIGANATIVCGHPIGEYAFVAAGAVVTKEVAPYSLVAGVPARRIGWMSRAGERLDGNLTCPRTGERYGENEDGRLEPLSELKVSR